MEHRVGSRNCPRCGALITVEAPQGLCPKCLLAEVAAPTAAGSAETPKPLPPSIEALSAAFSQLEILELIGQGGMGFVFKARQPKLDRFVALKILPETLASDPAFADRFAREGRVLARLNHPNIVTVHDFGQAGPFYYLLMEFVDGVNLRQAMQVGRFNPDQALAIVPKICDALQFAHSEGILHRDIKPENILLDAKGRVKIADFGIAKILGAEAVVQPEGRAAAEHNVTGAIGTPHYMAPEQFERSRCIDQRADIYSLGVVFYEMLTGELPLGRFAPPSEKSTADPRLDRVVLRALEKEPDRRTATAADVKTQVETIASTPPRGAVPEGQGAPRESGRGARAWFALRRGVFAGFTGFSIVVALAFAITAVQPKIYMTSARVELAGQMNAPYDPYRVQTEFARFTSRETLLAVATRLDLYERWAEKRGSDESLDGETVVQLLRRSLTLRQSRNTSLVEITAYSDSAELAAEIANTVAEVYSAPPLDRGRIIDRAIVPDRPVRPNLPLNLAFGAGVGLGAAFLAFLGVGLFTYFRKSGVRPANSSVPRRSLPPPLLTVAAFFILGGLVAIWSVVAERRVLHSNLNIGIFALPIGIGLLRCRPWWRKAAIAFIWITLAVSFVSLMTVGWNTTLFEGNWISKVAYQIWRPNADRSNFVAPVLMFQLFFASFFVGAYWILVRPDVTVLFQTRGFRLPWIEWSVLAVAVVGCILILEFRPAAFVRPIYLPPSVPETHIQVERLHPSSVTSHEP